MFPLTEKTTDAKYLLLKITFGFFIYQVYSFKKTVPCYEMQNYRIELERQGKPA